MGAQVDTPPKPQTFELAAVPNCTEMNDLFGEHQMTPNWHGVD
jgi:hypothetical protein